MLQDAVVAILAVVLVLTACAFVIAFTLKTSQKSLCNIPQRMLTFSDVMYSESTRVLIVFAVADRAEDIANLTFFLRVGLQKSKLTPQHIDTVVSSDGPLVKHPLPPDLTAKFTHLTVSHALCRDWSLYFAGLRAHHWGEYHDVVLLLNGTILGPLETKGRDWLAPFVRDLDTNTWMTGISVNPLHFTAGDMRAHKISKWDDKHLQPHVQSMFLVTTPKAIQKLREWGTWPTNDAAETKICDSKISLIKNLEVGTSMALLQHGHNISCLFKGFAGVDYVRMTRITQAAALLKKNKISLMSFGDIWNTRDAVNGKIILPESCGNFVKINHLGLLPAYAEMKTKADKAMR